MKPVIIIDSREQKPFEFPDHETVSRAMRFGDYTVRGLEAWICIERKSFNDLFGTYTKGLRRFVKQLEKMAAIDRAYLVIECSVGKVMRGHPRTAVKGPLLLEMVLETCSACRVVPLFCTNREAARDVAEFLLVRAGLRAGAYKGGPDAELNRRKKLVYGET